MPSAFNPKNITVHRGDGSTRANPHVQYFEYQPGNGTRYSLFVSELPADIEGGEVGSHVLVTLYCPFTAAYVLATDGYLTWNYFYSKFYREGLPVADLYHLYHLVGHVLLRKTENIEAPVGAW